MKVAGRKTMVKIVIAFIEELSADILRPISMLTELSSWVTVLKTYIIGTLHKPVRKSLSSGSDRHRSKQSSLTKFIAVSLRALYVTSQFFWLFQELNKYLIASPVCRTASEVTSASDV